MSVARNNQCVNISKDFAIGGVAGALSTVVIPEATAVPMIGGLLIGATFLTVFELSHRFLRQQGMNENFDSRAARIAVGVSRVALALLAAVVASIVVATLAGYSLTALELVAICISPLAVKWLIFRAVPAPQQNRGERQPLFRP